MRRREADLHLQVYRVMLGVIWGVETFLQYLRGKAVLHLTDCAPVCVVMELGSGPSEFLQQHVLQLWRLTAMWVIHMVTGWVPGEQALAMIGGGAKQILTGKPAEGRSIYCPGLRDPRGPAQVSIRSQINVWESICQ